jgi:hypothetical protein
MPPLGEGQTDDAVANGVDIAYEGGSHHHWQGNEQPEHELGSYLLKCIKINKISVLRFLVSVKSPFIEKTLSRIKPIYYGSYFTKRLTITTIYKHVQKDCYLQKWLSCGKVLGFNNNGTKRYKKVVVVCLM